MLLELLSPAKNYEQGCEAINHGADAVYIGAPAFGARVAAGNSLSDIEQLTRYAHLYHAKVFATVNTLLFDDEVEEAVKLIHQLYDIGVDAAIIQDLGLLECDLPPIELHASTQTHNATVERVKFLEKAGFSRVILARETNLQQMNEMHKASQVELEAFIQGALCVSYSGQCYMSQYLNGRSGNRGCCGQPCRSTYDLYDSHGNLLVSDEHLLSLKDFSAAKHISSMVSAGITSFKIEGRLKDMSYVKNVTAYYRQLLDKLMENGNGEYRPASSGQCQFYFVPDLEKTFNRGFTDYFLEHRQPMASRSTQKSLGKKIGNIVGTERGNIIISTMEPLTSGDGLCFFNIYGKLEGFFVNHVQQTVSKKNKTEYIVQPNRMPDSLANGTEVWRNNDQLFEKQLQGRTAVRKIDIDIMLSDTSDGLQLLLTDDDGCQGHAHIVCEKALAQNQERAIAQTDKQLRKLGDTLFQARKVSNQCQQPYFLPTSVLNELRREAVDALKEDRLRQHLWQRPHPRTPQETDNAITDSIDYRYNVLNKQCEQFYRNHGATEVEYGIEKTLDYADKALMTTKYCLRYELGCCLQEMKTTPPEQKTAIGKMKQKSVIPNNLKGPLFLKNNKNWFRLEFDCKNCQMKVLLAEKSPLDGKNKQKQT